MQLCENSVVRELFKTFVVCFQKSLYNSVSKAKVLQNIFSIIKSIIYDIFDANMAVTSATCNNYGDSINDDLKALD